MMWVASEAYYSAIFLAFAATINATPVKDDSSLALQPTSNGIQLVLTQDGQEKLVGTIGLGIDFSASTCVGRPTCEIDDVTLSVESVNAGYRISWETQSKDIEFRDCFDLKIGEWNWYGGPQRWQQRWPIEKLTITPDEAYVIKRSDNHAVAERYWLNSKGAYIFIDDRAPLFIDQNNEEEGKVCFIAKLQEPYINRERIFFSYTIVALDDPKLAHLHAINSYLGKPTDHPDAAMIKEPIWTTWAKYYRNINDDVVIEFAKSIRNAGYENGQIEIDDNWERCYGSQEFTDETFSDIINTVQTLKDMNFRVSLWVHPFVNDDCESVASEGTERDSNSGCYYVRDPEGNTTASWWDGDSAHQIDFTNPDAAEWYSARLRKLQESPGIDSYKFDAGEVNYAKQPSVYDNVDVETIPNVLTESYIRTVSAFGKLIEARSAWRTQDIPAFTRMIDKDSNWDDQNGLYTLITTLLQMNMNGYGLVLPDMIGGNGYSGAPNLELVIRWAQANTFMPAMQFSFLPWDYSSDDYDGPAIVKKFVDLHEEYSDEIIKAMEANIATGSPVNAPIWWIDPTDEAALAKDDEYLLGEKILVAPIYAEGATSRTVYLPKGSWKDGNSDSTYDGPIVINDYNAPIDVLPYFIKQ
ncbi:hypothetical protein NQ317_005956 [Molorchus minor]|uniref:Glycoside hydrolase family 31 n=1 Tax=Molorchus minor TaxID=1323400 RepID=A0ABQ9JJW2_9CUCU|nr:hypothetical protein NQ317_005956 [Molorchus minor]